jgi:membrane associated rhomboid family serine protease
MVIPIGDTPNPRGVAYVTQALIAVNVAVYVLITLPLSVTTPSLDDPAVAEYLRVIVPAVGERIPLDVILRQLSAYDLFVFDHGFRPAAPSVSDLLLSLFLHAGVLHLAGNMLFLWIYGDNVEHHLGRGRYLLTYLGTGVAASGVHALTAPGSEIPSIGASGAISGVLGCYFVWFPHNHVRLLWLFPPLFMNVFLVPARIVLGLYIVADNLLPFLLASEGAGIAYGAHIGGFFAGLGLAWAFARHEVRASPREYARPHRARNADGVSAGRLRRLVADDRLADAAMEYFSLPASASRALAPDEGLRLAHWLETNGHASAALTVLRRLLRYFPNGPRRAEMHVAAGLALLERLGEPTAAYQHFLDALSLEPDPPVAALARRGIAAIEALQKRQWGRPYVRNPSG